MAVFHPIDIGLGEAFGLELHFPVLNNLKSGLCKRLHLYEPLIRGQRLNGGLTAVAGADIVRIGLGLYKEALCLKIRNDSLSRLKAIHTCILAAVLLADGGIIVEGFDNFKVMALADLEVVRVMGGGDLHAARSEIALHIFVRDHGDLSANEGQDQLFTNEVRIALVLGMHGNGSITQHGFRTGGCNNYVLALAILYRVANLPECTRLLGILDLGIRQSGAAVRAPVDDAVAAVDQALVIKVDKHLANGTGASLIHREALA